MDDAGEEYRKDAERKALQMLMEAQTIDSAEQAHVIADKALCMMLNALGYKNLVDEFENVGKWYA